MGQLRYLSAMKYCSFVIGNSSSGIIEAPIMKKVTINIGDRQKGRLMTRSIINCEPKKDDVVKAINLALNKEFKKKVETEANPYGIGNTSKDIILILKEYLFNNKILSKKKFYDIKF